MEQEFSDWLSSLFEQTYEKLHKTASRFTGCPDTAEELVQDTFVLAATRGKKLMEHPKPEAWLMLTLTNLCTNYRKRHSLTEVSLDVLFHIAAPEADLSLLELLPAKLPDKDKEILIWRFQEQLSYRMIADRLGLSEAACRSRFFRAVARCRKLLEASEDEL